eukprot:g51531.t1
MQSKESDMETTAEEGSTIVNKSNEEEVGAAMSVGKEAEETSPIPVADAPSVDQTSSDTPSTSVPSIESQTEDQDFSVTPKEKQDEGENGVSKGQDEVTREQEEEIEEVEEEEEQKHSTEEDGKDTHDRQHAEQSINKVHDSSDEKQKKKDSRGPPTEARDKDSGKPQKKPTAMAAKHSKEVSKKRTSKCKKDDDSDEEDEEGKASKEKAKSKSKKVDDSDGEAEEGQASKEQTEKVTSKSKGDDDSDGEGVEGEWKEQVEKVIQATENPDVDDELCYVCFDGNVEDGDEIVFCSDCDVCVHQSCYGIKVVPQDDWYCDGCAYKRKFPSKAKKVHCYLCPNKNIGALKKTENGRWAHAADCVWIPEISFDDPKIPTKIIGLASLNKVRWDLKCGLCRKKEGCCIQCIHGNCRFSFHTLCAKKRVEKREMRMEIRKVKNIMEPDDPEKWDVGFLSFCPKHVKEPFDEDQYVKDQKVFRYPHLFSEKEKKLMEAQAEAAAEAERSSKKESSSSQKVAKRPTSLPFDGQLSAKKTSKKRARPVVEEEGAEEEVEEEKEPPEDDVPLEKPKKKKREREEAREEEDDEEPLRKKKKEKKKEKKEKKKKKRQREESPVAEGGVEVSAKQVREALQSEGNESLLPSPTKETQSESGVDPNKLEEALSSPHREMIIQVDGLAKVSLEVMENGEAKTSTAQAAESSAEAASAQKESSVVVEKKERVLTEAERAKCEENWQRFLDWTTQLKKTIPKLRTFEERTPALRNIFIKSQDNFLERFAEHMVPHGHMVWIKQWVKEAIDKDQNNTLMLLLKSLKRLVVVGEYNLWDSASSLRTSIKAAMQSTNSSIAKEARQLHEAMLSQRRKAKAEEQGAKAESEKKEEEEEEEEDEEDWKPFKLEKFLYALILPEVLAAETYRKSIPKVGKLSRSKVAELERESRDREGGGATSEPSPPAADVRDLDRSSPPPLAAGSADRPDQQRRMSRDLDQQRDDRYRDRNRGDGGGSGGGYRGSGRDSRDFDSSRDRDSSRDAYERDRPGRGRGRGRGRGGYNGRGGRRGSMDNGPSRRGRGGGPGRQGSREPPGYERDGYDARDVRRDVRAPYDGGERVRDVRDSREHSRGPPATTFANAEQDWPVRPRDPGGYGGERADRDNRDTHRDRDRPPPPQYAAWSDRDRDRDRPPPPHYPDSMDSYYRPGPGAGGAGTGRRSPPHDRRWPPQSGNLPPLHTIPTSHAPRGHPQEAAYSPSAPAMSPLARPSQPGPAPVSSQAVVDTTRSDPRARRRPDPRMRGRETARQAAPAPAAAAEEKPLDIEELKNFLDSLS